MVGRRNATPLLSSSIFPTSQCENSNQLIFPGLGCNYGACQISRSLGVGKAVVPHKQERTADLFHCSGIFCFPSKRHSCSAVSGQYCCCKLSESRRGNKVTSFVRSRNCNLGIVFTEKDLSFSNSHTRHCKQNPRWSVSSEARKHRMDVRFQCFSSDSGCLSAASSESLCVSPQPSTPELFFLDPRSTGYGNRCFQHSMEIQSVLPVSSFSSHSEMYSENKTGSDRCIAHNASLEISTMVPSLLEMLMDLPALLPLHAKLLHLPMFPSQVHPLIEKKINLAIWPVSGNPSKSEGFLKGCPKYCFPPGDPVQRNITNQHGNHLIAGVLENRKIRFLAL